MNKTLQLDTKSVIRNFKRRAENYKKHAWLMSEMSGQLLQRLEYMNFEPETILDMGCGPHDCYVHLQERYNKANIFGIDICEAMLQQVRIHSSKLICANAHKLPLKTNSVDLIIANGLLLWCNLTVLFKECFRILAPEGIFLFSSFGPDTLNELMTIFKKIDNYPHTYTFLDMHDVGDSLLASGFADPVMDMDFVTVTYDTMTTLFDDLRGAGMSNLHSERRRGLMTPNTLQKLQLAYEALRLENNELPASFEIIYGHGWIPPVKRFQQGDEVFIPIEQLTADR